MKEHTRIILHLDYDSFFASVEQQANPKLRGKPIAISGHDQRRGIACTASREAKKLGVKTGMPIFKARELCPNLIVVKGDFPKYQYIHNQSLRIFQNYTDFIQPFSIDEAFLDITHTVQFFNNDPLEVCKKLKSEIKEAFGEYVTCSIGVGPNKLMAKLVSEINKPNGVFVVDGNNMQEVLLSRKLTDFCGIGSRTEAHLLRLGIDSVAKLQTAPIKILYTEFGKVTGSFLKNASQGIDFSEVTHLSYKPKPKSISHQHTLYKNTTDMENIRNNIQHLSCRVGERLRNHEMLGRSLYLSLKDKDFKRHTAKLHLKKYIDADQDIYRAACIMLTELKCDYEVRLIGLGISNLISKESLRLPLFSEEDFTDSSNKMSKLLDGLNKKLGKDTVFAASTLYADRVKHKMSSFLKYE